MAEGVMIGSECADWWERRNKEYHQELEQYVLDNPGNFSIFVATGKATAADFAMTMWVDLARLGEGAAEGSVKGILQDVFRVLNFVPEAKVLQGSKTLLSRAVQLVSNWTFWRKLEGGLCASISIGQALQRTGHRLGIPLADIAKALEVPLLALRRGLNDPQIERALSALGVQFTKLDGAKLRTWEALKQAAAAAKGPLVVGITAADGALHSVLVGKTLTGVKIIDRYGMFGSLDELAKHYRRGAWTIDAVPILSLVNAVIDPAMARAAERLGVLAFLVRESIAVFDINHKTMSMDQLDADFDKYVERKGKKKHVLTAPETTIVGGFTVEVAAGKPDRSTLSGIAKAQYGEFELWPLIYDLNRDKIGTNPNRLVPGMRLLLLPKERYTTAELAAARSRAPSWKNHAR